MLTCNIRNCSVQVLYYLNYCCIKMPIYSGYFVENQKRAFHSFKELSKLVSGEGNFNKLSDKILLKSIEKFIDLPDQQSLFKKSEKNN